MSDEPVSGTARGEVPARCLDLSLGGALLILTTALEVEAIHDFALDLDGETLWVQGEVRRCERAPRGGGYQVGIQFIGIDPQDERRLREFVGQRAR